MVKKKKKKRNGGRDRLLVSSSVESDFTVNDYANSASMKTGRMKKGHLNSWSRPMTAVARQSSPVNDSLAWYEKDLSDFDLTDQDENSEEEESIEEACARTESSKKKTRSEETGIVYPQDLWFLIGQHIHPGDVRSFGSICRGSHLVIHTAQFWISLYRRYYSPSLVIPPTLQPAAMEKIHGLQPHVVRSLFYTYPPFQERIKHVIPFESDPDILEGCRCIMMWHQHVKPQWHFFFKFYKERRRQCFLTQRPPTRQRFDPLLQPVNIHHNSEENCCVLKLVMNNFTYLPAVMGQCLIKCYISVGHAMRYHKVKLVFDSQNIAYNKRTTYNGVTLVMDPVLDMHVLHWWDPKYPYGDSGHQGR